MQLNEKYLLKGFNYFYENLYNTRTTNTPKVYSMLTSFLELLAERYGSVERLGENFLWQYLVFQFRYWRDIEEVRSKKIDLSYVIGKKALQRYLERDQEFDWQIGRDGIAYDRNDFKERIGYKEEKIETDFDSDDIYREQYFNQELGLSNCIVSTTLYNGNSEFCKKCNYVDDCKTVQRRKYPSIYKNRKIE